MSRSLALATAGAAGSPPPEFGRSPSFADQLTHALDIGIAELSHHLAAGDPAAAGLVAADLAGLGPGSTPAGDDVLVGGLAAAWLRHPPTLARELGVAVASAAAGRTTTGSFAWIALAAHGRAPAGWRHLGQALADSAAPHTITSASAALAGQGATSGRIALAAFRATLLATAPTPLFGAPLFGADPS